MSWNFICFSRILIREQLTLFLDDLEVQKCAHAQSKSFPICIFKTTKKNLIQFYRNENQFFCMIYPNIP